MILLANYKCVRGSVQSSLFQGCKYTTRNMYKLASLELQVRKLNKNSSKNPVLVACMNEAKENWELEEKSNA